MRKAWNKTHGMAGTPIFRIWCAMKNRCYNQNQKSYPNYGGRGITVCDQWCGSSGFARFMADMGERPDGYTIERRDNDGPYSPENCLWISRTDQAQNKRNNRWLTANGETRYLAEWARELKVNPAAILARLRLGWSVERAVTESAPERPNSKLTAADAAEIRRMYPGVSAAILGKRFGVCKKSVLNVLHSKTFKNDTASV